MKLDDFQKDPLLDLKSKKILQEKLLKREGLTSIAKSLNISRPTLYLELLYGVSLKDYESSNWKKYSPELAIFLHLLKIELDTKYGKQVVNEFLINYILK